MVDRYLIDTYTGDDHETFLELEASGAFEPCVIEYIRTLASIFDEEFSIIEYICATYRFASTLDNKKKAEFLSKVEMFIKMQMEEAARCIYNFEEIFRDFTDDPLMRTHAIRIREATYPIRSDIQDALIERKFSSGKFPDTVFIKSYSDANIERWAEKYHISQQDVRQIVHRVYGIYPRDF